MAAVLQSALLTFHNTIKLDNLDENALLREKRDNVLQRLRDRGLTFTPFNQGSYAMGTGLKPLNLDYDIDVGVVFRGPRPSDPLEAKDRVYNAALGHTPNVEWHRHCVRVQYTRQGEAAFHVDLAVYWEVESWGSNTLYLAVGKQHSGSDNKEWRATDPKGLVKAVSEKCSGEDRRQFTRIVRYLKRWKDFQFSIQGNAAPRGIALTAAAFDSFSPERSWNAQTEADYDDLAALRRVVRSTVNKFGSSARVSLNVPVAPRDDTCARMTDQQMREFKARLEALDANLTSAATSGSRQPLIDAFGADFPR
jgi:hypothetical protein